MVNLDLTAETRKALEGVLTDLKITHDTLTANNNKLMALREDLFQKKRLLAKKKKSLTEVHDHLKNVIAEEIDPHTKKPHFSNEIRRQAEFLERSAADAQARELEEQIDALTSSGAHIENTFESLIFDQEILKLDYSLGLRLVDFLTHNPK